MPSLGDRRLRRRAAEVGGLLELSFNFCDRDTLDLGVLDRPEAEPLRRVLNDLREVLLVILRRHV
jgi:hypothetical protein